MASNFSHRALLVWSTLAVASGCGQILGLSSYDVDPNLDPKIIGEAGAAGENNGGSSSTAGTHQGGKAGTAAGVGGSETSNAGEPGTPGGSTSVAGGGSGGQAGAGDGGAGGSAPDAKFKGCDGTPFEGNEAIIRSCILRVGCLIWNYPTDTISRCISQNTQNTYEGTKCTLDAQSCADIFACEGEHDATDFCADKDYGQYCDGDDAVHCGDYPYALDCVKYGGVCHDFGTEVGESGSTVQCELPNITSCTGTETGPACGGPSNGYKYECEGDIAFGTKCTNFAASCQQIGEDFGCFYPLNTCTAQGVSCANGRATWCDGDSKAVYDCGAVGLGCSTTGDYSDDNERQCNAPGCKPDDILNCVESCSGDGQLTLCYGGAPVTVDCKDYGFSSCVEYDYDCDGDDTINDCLSAGDTVHFADCE
jgi:hypothetical protein